MKEDQRTPLIHPGDTPKGVSIDWTAYSAFLEDTSLPDEDKQALIETLYGIMVSFVDLGFRINPPAEICGEINPLTAIAKDSLEDVIEYTEPQKTDDQDAGTASAKGGDNES